MKIQFSDSTVHVLVILFFNSKIPPTFKTGCADKKKQTHREKIHRLNTWYLGIEKEPQRKTLKLRAQEA